MPLKKSSFSSLSLSTMNNDSKTEEDSSMITQQQQQQQESMPQSSSELTRSRQQEQQQQQQQQLLRTKPPGLIALHRPILFGAEDGHANSSDNSSRWYYHARNMIQDHLKEFMAKANVTASFARRHTNNSFPHDTTTTTTLPSFPAVDLASGSGLLTVAMAQHFQRPKFTIDFEWYPTESTTGNNKDTTADMLEDSDGHPPISLLPPTTTNNKSQNELRSILQFLGQHPLPLFADRNGKAVYRGDSIRLVNLQTAKYNHTHGVVIGRDPKSPQRYGIQLGVSHNFQRCSIQSTNIVRDGNSMGEGILVDTTTTTTTTTHSFPTPTTTTTTSQENPLPPPREHHTMAQSTTSMVGDGNHQSLRYEKACQEEIGHERKEFFQGLLERSCEVDIGQSCTWSNIPSQIQRKCVLVTCTYFLTDYGSPRHSSRQEDDAWKNCLKLASQLLIVNGLFLTYDIDSSSSSDGGGGYGNMDIMMEYIRMESLYLVPVEIRCYSSNTNHPRGGDDDTSTRTSTRPAMMTMMLWRKVQDNHESSSSSSNTEVEEDAMEAGVVEANSTRFQTEVMSMTSPTQ